MRWLWSWPIVMVAPLLVGCTTVQDLAGIPRAGYQNNGSYVLTVEEEQMPCRQVESRISNLAREIEKYPVEAANEQEALPVSLDDALGRMFGRPGDGLKASRNLQRANAESAALTALAAKKHCI